MKVIGGLVAGGSGGRGEGRGRDGMDATRSSLVYCLTFFFDSGKTMQRGKSVKVRFAFVLFLV